MRFCCWQRVAGVRHLPKRLSFPIAAIIGDKLFVAGGPPNGADPQPGV
ncbi:MAG: hypothetical protein M2R45_03935 [Verrucomicrobia subdivision 3 bacterium]|nr:hypothetical protein [Limisphaerales bacterium]MCS1417698.1 hypothetical protein [Limisphaerales bacterium]